MVASSVSATALTLSTDSASVHATAFAVPSRPRNTVALSGGISVIRNKTNTLAMLMNAWRTQFAGFATTARAERTIPERPGSGGSG